MRGRLHFEDGSFGSHRLRTNSVRVGRGEECEVELDHASVSRYHACLTLRGEFWWVEDLGSTNGTLVNGRRCREPILVRSGDEIQFGLVRALYESPTSEPAATNSSHPAEGEESPVREGSPGIAPAPGGTAQRARRGRKLKRRSGLPSLVGFLFVLAALGGGAYKLQQWRAGNPVASSSQRSPGAGFAEGPSERASGAGDDAESKSSATDLFSAALDGSPSVGRESSRSSVTPGIESETRPDRKSGMDRVDKTAPVEKRSHPSDSETPEGVSDRSGERGVWPPPSAEDDLVAAALARRDAGELASLFTYGLDESGGARVRAALQGQRVYSIRWDGALPKQGLAALTNSLGFTASREDVAEVVALPFPVTIIDLEVRVRCEQDYRVGLGRQIGETRLAPHPKSLEVELHWILPGDDSKKLGRFEVSTPRVPPSKLSPRGLSESEVWRRTVFKLEPRLIKALAKIRPTTGPSLGSPR